jgi:hypothetical protein
MHTKETLIAIYEEILSRNDTDEDTWDTVAKVVDTVVTRNHCSSRGLYFAQVYDIIKALVEDQNDLDIENYVTEYFQEGN